MGALATVSAAESATEAREGRAADLAVALAALAAGQTAVLERVWDLCANDLFSLALWRTSHKEDAEDAVQEVFVKLARDPRKAARARCPRSYLLAMARSAAIDQVRKRRAESLESTDLLEAPTADPVRQADSRKASVLVAQLPAKLREVVYLRYYLDLTFAEIARVTRVPHFTAASRYRLAMNRLREQMGD